jgi:hypothetical protein
MERQSHGFEYEKIVSAKYNLTSDKNYTGLWDAYMPNGVPCVIKTFKQKTELPLSDIFINSSRNTDFYLIYGIWKGDKTNIIEEKIILVDINKWKELFEWDNYKELNNWIKNLVSNNYNYDLTWRLEVKEWKKKWGEHKTIQPRFKRDHKTQRRIQTAVANKKIETFLNYVEKK